MADEKRHERKDTEREGRDEPAPPDESAGPSTPEEKVAEASRESFPASDPPGWIAGSATHRDMEEGEEEDEDRDREGEGEDRDRDRDEEDEDEDREGEEER